jgi:hypothetical protein
MGIKMIVGIQGTSSFDDYQVFLRAMAVSMSSLSEEDPYFYLYSAGPANINSMAMEFANLSERGLKARGKSIKYKPVPPLWISDNILDLNYFAFLSKEKEQVSRLVDEAKTNNVEYGIFRY